MYDDLILKRGFQDLGNLSLDDFVKNNLRGLMKGRDPERYFYANYLEDMSAGGRTGSDVCVGDGWRGLHRL